MSDGGIFKPGVGVMAAGTAVAVGGIGSIWSLLDPTIITILVVGSVVVALIMAAYPFILKLKDKGKAGSFMSRLKSAASATPAGVADPAKRARLDDLRRKFEEGVEKFRSNGKDIYSLPWYLVVGPSGSGKTEAIRHCGVGFPPGLQDCLQGTGGTVNMHWWFTNHAVMVDTAGRMFMEEVGAGTSSEWKEFLKLLRMARPNAPVNGMLLFIGIDSLIKDSAEKIEANAGAIARQLDTIQRTLDVRFPVYVVISKCDLIPGFREFFDGVNDPQAQGQMLGWSNPASLDEAFKPEMVDEHIRTVRLRLLRRRAGILQDPVNTEDPSARRTNEVDELFSLPDNLAKIAPRLRRYLELIFVAGEWSPKPLFLRGLYFTSSMREGEALDQDLAAALGVTLDSLPGGKTWDRDRSYFLRDLFMSKAFREKGLVTRDSNVSNAQRKRRTMLSVAAIVAGLAFLAAIIFAQKQLGDAIGPHAAAWKAIADAVQGDAEDQTLAVIPPKRTFGAFSLNPAYSAPADAKSFVSEVASNAGLSDSRSPARTPGTLLAKLGESGLVDPVKVPPLFPFGNFKSELPEAKARLVERVSLAPAAGAAYIRLFRPVSEKTEVWNATATAALVELLKIESVAAGRKVEEGQAGPLLRPLLAVALRAADSEPSDAFDKVSGGVAPDGAAGEKTPTAGVDLRVEVEAMQKEINAAYQAGEGALVPEMVRGYVEAVKSKTDTFRFSGVDRDLTYSPAIAVERFVAAWEGRLESDGGLKIAQAARIRAGAEQFKRIRDELGAWLDEQHTKAAAKAGLSAEDYQKFVGEFGTRTGQLQAARDTLTAALKEVGNFATIDEMMRLLASQTAASASDEFKAVAEALPATKAGDEKKDESDLARAAETLSAGRERVLGKDGAGGLISARRDNLIATLSGNADLKALLQKNGVQMGFEQQFAAYDAARQQVAAPEFQGTDGELVGAIATRLNEINDATKAPAGDAVEGARVGKALAIARAGRVSATARKFLEVVAARVSSGGGLGAVVSELAGAGAGNDPGSRVPMLDPDKSLVSDRAYDADKGRAILRAISALRAEFESGTGATAARLPLAQAVRDALGGVTQAESDYRAKYVAYWGEELSKRMAVSSRWTASWSAFRDELPSGDRVEEVNTALKVALKAAEDALDLSDEGAMRWRKAAQDAGAKLSASTTQAARDTISALKALPRDWGEARKQLLNKPTFDDVLNASFKVYAAPSGDGPVYSYWNSVCEGALEALNTSAADQAAQLQANLAKSRRLPLVRDASVDAGVMSMQEIRDLSDAMSGLDEVRLDLAGGGPRDVLRVKARSLAQSIATKAGVPKDRLDAMRDVLRALAKGGLTVQVYPPASKEAATQSRMSDDEATQQFRPRSSGELMEIACGGESIREAINIVSPGELKSGGKPLPVPSAKGSTLTLQVKSNQAGGAAGPLTKQAGEEWWAIVGAIRDGARPLGGSKFLVKCDSGQGAYFLIFDFSAELPDVSKWPKLEDLPSGR